MARASKALVAKAEWKACWHAGELEARLLQLTPSPHFALPPRSRQWSSERVTMCGDHRALRCCLMFCVARPQVALTAIDEATRDVAAWELTDPPGSGAEGTSKVAPQREFAPAHCCAAFATQLPALAERALLLGEEAEQRQYVSAVVAGAIEGFLGVLERRAGGVHAFAELATPTGAVCARAELFQPAPSNQASCISLFVFPCQPWPALLWPTCTDVARLLAAPLATRGRWRYARARRRTWSML